jgi:predicted transcriptional regulator
MSKYIITGELNYTIEQLVSVSNKVLNYRYTRSEISDHVGIIRKKNNELELYPITETGEAIIKSYLKLPMYY